MRTLILQSHQYPLPHRFLESCVASVRHWAAGAGYEYRLLDDELFDPVPRAILDKLAQRTIIATDVARLHWLHSAVQQGYDRAVWFDADMLVIDPQQLQLPQADFAVGRETWVQPHNQQPRLYRKVHNAFLQTVTADVVLPFYLQTAQRLLAQHQGGMPNQVVGPKLLTALHNIVPFDVLETVNMLPPIVAEQLLAGGGSYLEHFKRSCAEPPAALNLCGSLLDQSQLDAARMQRLVAILLQSPALLRS